MCENGNECFLTIQLSENTCALFCLIDNVHNNTYYKPFITMFNLDISSIFFCNPVYILQTITMLFPLQTDNITIFFFYFPIKFFLCTVPRHITLHNLKHMLRNILILINTKCLKHRFIIIHKGHNHIYSSRIICQSLILLGRS